MPLLVRANAKNFLFNICGIKPGGHYVLLDLGWHTVGEFLPRDVLYCKARYCDRMSSVTLSVCLSVRPSVCDVGDCDHIGWNSW